MSAMHSPESPSPAPAVAPWFPPPTYPPPQPQHARHGDRPATWSVVAGILGIVLGFATGVGGLILGPIAYFMGKTSVGRIDEAKGALTGRGTAVTGWVLGVIATIIGAAVTLFWIVVLLEASSTAS